MILLATAVVSVHKNSFTLPEGIELMHLLLRAIIVTALHTGQQKHFKSPPFSSFMNFISPPDGNKHEERFV